MTVQDPNGSVTPNKSANSPTWRYVYGKVFALSVTMLSTAGLTVHLSGPLAILHSMLQL